MDNGTSIIDRDKHTVELNAEDLWQFQVDFHQELTIKVISGIVEINGTELPNNTELRFKGMKNFIYCIRPATIKYSGTFANQQVVLANSSNDSKLLREYLALHLALQNERSKSPIIGPRVGIFGNKSVGKSTLTRILCSYSVKQHGLPMLVNLNPAEGVYSIPGTLTATVVNDIFDVELGWGQSPVSGASFHHPGQPAVTYYGYDHINSNPKFYKYNVEKISTQVNNRLNNDLTVNQTGVIVDTPGLSFDKDYELIEQLVNNFKLNIIIVLGDHDDEKLSELRTNHPSLKVLTFERANSCIEKDDVLIRGQQQLQIKQYFYGTRNQVLSPFTITSVDYSRSIFFKAVELNKIMGEVTNVESTNNMDGFSVLPIGEGIDEEERAFLEEIRKHEEKEALEAKQKNGGIDEDAEMKINDVKEEVKEEAKEVNEEKEPESKEEIVRPESNAEKEEEPVLDTTEGDNINNDISAESNQSNDQNDEIESKKEEEKEPELITEGKLVEKVEPASSYLQNSIIAFLQIDYPEDREDESKIIEAGVLFFGYISSANDPRKKMSVLLPVQSNWPTQPILFGGFRFVD